MKALPTSGDSCGHYRITFTIDRRLGGDYDHGDFIDNISAKISYLASEGDGTPEPVGTMSAYVLRVSRAMDEGWSLFEVCDCHSGFMEEVYSTIFDPNTDDLLSVTGEEESLLNGADILAIDSIEMVPEHRGKRLGLLAVTRLLNTFGLDCALAVIDPTPVYPENAAEADTRDTGAASKKLAAYWSRLGFVQIDGSPLMAFDFTKALPAINTLARPGLRTVAATPDEEAEAEGS